MSCTTACVAPSPSQAHCSACHTTFGGVAAFDAHNVGGRCRPPAEIGCVDNGHGVYRVPLTDAKRAQLAALRQRGDAPSARPVEPQAAETGSVVGGDTPSDSDPAESRSGGSA